jgi:glycosyltransferase involved in cell wall biosynthesis
MTSVLMLLENNAYPKDVRVRREAQSLTQNGYQVTVICPASPNQPFTETVEGVRVYRFPAPPNGNGLMGYIVEYGYAMIAVFVLSLLVFFRHGFDIIHAHNPPDTFFIIALIYKAFGKRFIFDHHDLSPELYDYGRFNKRGNRLVYRVLVWLEKASCRLADHVIVTNQSYKKIDVARSGLPENRITIVRNGPDLRTLKNLVPSKKYDDKINIMYAGIIGYQDGVDYLVRALHHLVYELKMTHFSCLIMGEGDAVPTIRKMIHELNLEDYVAFGGWVEYKRLAGLISVADICVAPEPSNPYNDRCTMMKIIDYMAFAKPIVAFDLPEHRASAADAALYAVANDETDFALKIAQLMNDAKQRKTLGEIGKRHVERSLAWLYQEKQLLKAYERVIQGKRALSTAETIVLNDSGEESVQS